MSAWHDPDLSGLGGRFGPYFALDVAAGPGWAAVADLGDPATGAFDRRVAAVRAALAASGGRAAAEIDERVAASVAQLGVCARIVAPPVAWAALTGRAPRLDPARLRWRDELGGPFPLAVEHGAWDPGARGQGRALAQRFTGGVIAPAVAPLVAVAARSYRLSAKVLWGNVASAVAGAAKMVGLADPSLAGAAWGLVDALCGAAGPLGGSGGRETPARFRRRSCCLIYQLSTGPARPVCEDCVLALPRHRGGR